MPHRHQAMTLIAAMRIGWSDAASPGQSEQPWDAFVKQQKAPASALKVVVMPPQDQPLTEWLAERFQTHLEKYT